MPDNAPVDDNSIKVNILLKALEHTQTHYRDIGHRSQTLFSWIGSVLLAVTAVIAAIGPGALSAFGTVFQIAEKGIHIFQLHDLFIDTHDSKPGIPASGEQMVKGVFVMADQLLAPKDQGIVTSQGGHCSLKAGAA